MTLRPLPPRPRRSPGLTAPWRLWVLVLAILLVTAGLTHARAGGAGGLDSSGGSWSGGGDSDDAGFIIYLVIQIFEVSVRLFGLGPTLAGIAIIVVVLWIAQRRGHPERTTALGQMARMEKAKPSASAASLDPVRKLLPDFDPGVMDRKVRTAFTGIQEAWSAQDLSPVRSFISDGVWQRFHTQFRIMKSLDQRNHLSRIRILDLSPAKARVEGSFVTIVYRIHASMNDRFESRLLPGATQEGSADFVEYWTFVRRVVEAPAGRPAPDLYHGHHCPSCGAPLPDGMGELSVCGYCSAVINSPEWDWILTEISQAEDMGARLAQTSLRGGTQRLDAAIRDIRPATHADLLRDKASNAWFQIQAALSLGPPEGMHRFVVPDLYRDLTQARKQEFTFHRLFVRNLDLVDLSLDDGFLRVDFLVSSTAQRVAWKTPGKAVLVDPVPVQRQEYLRMERRIDAPPSKGNLLMHQCPHCGGPLKDSSEAACPWCQTILSAGTHDWVVTALAPASAGLPSGVGKRVNRAWEQLEKLYSVRDLAWNNLLVIAAADGRLSPEEEEWLQRLGQRWQVPRHQIQQLFDEANLGRLSLRMPQDPERQQRIYRLMVDLAGADGRISPEEQRCLDYIAETWPQARNGTS